MVHQKLRGVLGDCLHEHRRMAIRQLHARYRAFLVRRNSIITVIGTT